MKRRQKLINGYADGTISEEEFAHLKQFPVLLAAAKTKKAQLEKAKKATGKTKKGGRK